jgi:hypothetical protein
VTVALAGATGVASMAGTADAAGAAVGSDVGLAVFFLVGLLGGAHCIGMCGPLVTMYADHLRESDRGGTRRVSSRQFRQQALFNVGRTAGYAAVGGLMGLLGALVFDAAAVAAIANPVRAAAGIAVGVVILLTGGSYLLYGRADLAAHVGRSGAGRPGVFARVTAAIAEHVDTWVRGPRVLALGAVHAFLPCPLLYPAYLYAVATGSPLAGAASLAALGVGTFPTMLGIGTVFGAVGTDTRVRLQRVLGVLFIAMGYLPLAHGLMLVGVHLPHPTIPVYQPLG